MSALPPRLQAPQLVLALHRLPQRTARLLTLRLLDGLDPEQAARAYGVEPQALAIHTLRAALLLRQALGPGDSPLLPLHAQPLPAAREAALAAALERALATGPGPGDDPEALALAAPLRALALEAEAVRRLLTEQEARLRDSPGQRRADLLRRAALVALVALALWLYFRDGA